MVSKFLILLIFFSSNCMKVGLCQDMAALQAALGGSPPPCLQSLIPCQAYLKSDGTPPTECCGPLKDAMKKDMSCLCKLFNNDQILKSVNLTRQDALKLPSHCDKDIDVSVCEKLKDTASPDSAPTTSETKASPPASQSSSAKTSKSAPPPTESAAHKASYFGGFNFIAVVAIVLFVV